MYSIMMQFVICKKKKKPYIFINKDKSCRREKLKEISLLFYCLLLLFVFTIFYYIFSNSVRLIHTTINKEIHFLKKQKNKMSFILSHPAAPFDVC